MSRWIGYLLFGVEALVLCGLILTTRCTNYHDVFVGGNIYFVDADCYARMTRVRLCAQHPGLILRHHSFENYPEGTRPHTTSPLDYAILSLSILLHPLSARPIDLAGALVSPVAAVITGLFLLWWARKMRFRFRWAMLGLYLLSPILVHGTALGRPDHQSVLILLITVAVCADWTLLNSEARGWKIVSGLTWGLAIWVSAYEPLILFAISSLVGAGLSLRKRATSLTNESVEKSRFLDRGLKWFFCAAILLIALLIERRVPAFAVFANDPVFTRWSRTIGELAPVPLWNAAWFHWLGWLLVAAPVLIAFNFRREASARIPLTILILLFVTFLLTLWQSRWAYFLAMMFVIALPELLGVMRSRSIGWIVFVISLWPILRDWDMRLWPDPLTASRRIEQQREAVELRQLAASMISPRTAPFLAPWWLSPAIGYWSGQPGVAGSSHESLPGIADSARFFLATDPVAAGDILLHRQVAWVVSYDAERVETNSSAILDESASPKCLARVLDQRPGQAPSYLSLSIQTGTQKLFQVADKW